MISEMAQLFNRIGQLGLGVAVVGGVVNSALYNGMLYLLYKLTLQKFISFYTDKCC